MRRMLKRGGMGGGMGGIVFFAHFTLPLNPFLHLFLSRLSMRDFELSTDDFKAVHLPNLQTLKLGNCGKVSNFCPSPSAAAAAVSSMTFSKNTRRQGRGGGVCVCVCARVRQRSSEGKILNSSFPFRPRPNLAKRCIALPLSALPSFHGRRSAPNIESYVGIPRIPT